MKILITGGAGFIGSHVVRLFVNRFCDAHIYNLDALTYAGNLENLKDVQEAQNYTFIKANITDASRVEALFYQYQFDKVIHLAAESHVDRSISDPMAFVRANVLGTMNLLNACLKVWGDDFENKLFYHISTDEVYGTLGETGLFTETTPYMPNSPYAASKASSDHFVRAYGETYDLPYIISNCSNNYGPNQFPEKLIPLFIHNIVNEKSLPVYGDGNYTRDWLYVKDHAAAIALIFEQGKEGETYNIGGVNEWKNIDLVHLLCEIMDSKLKQASGSSLSRKRRPSASLINFVKDRQGHDKRYAIDASKIERELAWKPSVTFEEGLKETVEWYLKNDAWLTSVTTGAYQEYYKKQYQ